MTILVSCYPRNLIIDQYIYRRGSPRTCSASWPRSGQGLLLSRKHPQNCPALLAWTMGSTALTQTPAAPFRFDLASKNTTSPTASLHPTSSVFLRHTAHFPFARSFRKIEIRRCTGPAEFPVIGPKERRCSCQCRGRSWVGKHQARSALDSRHFRCSICRSFAR